MNELNKEQEQAARFLYGVCAVIAVPGSGKTLTMTRRIANLIMQGISPENILGLTFTRNAAEEMKNRLALVLGDQAERVNLSTIHSFCHRLLRDEGLVFEMLTGKEQIIFLSDVMKQLKVKDLSLGMILREISLAKNNMISVDDFRDLYFGDSSMQKVADVFSQYEQEKRKRMRMDFDDLLLETHRLLTEDENVREKYRGIFRHVLVDEYQDTNPAQMEIIKLLTNGSDNGSSFWCTGDDWQSIYNFTGASIGNILRFQETFPGSEMFILNMNYRSTPQIIRACQNLIRNNEKKIDKRLETQNPDGEEVVLLESSNEEQEAVSVMYEIKDLTMRKGYDYKDIAILYRANFQSRVIEEVFSQHKVPYHIENGLNFYQRREVKILLDYLRLIQNPNCEQGDEAFLLVVNVPNRYIGKKFTMEIQDFAQGKGLHLYAALKEMPIALPYIRHNVRAFIDLIETLRKETVYPSEAIATLRAALDYDRHITDEDIPSPDDQKIQNLNQLQMSAARFVRIEEFLQYTETFQGDTTTDSKDGVRLMTIHKAKGLEFPAVFVVGLVEGILPSKKGDIEEERRIAFVGISRAMKLLYLSYSLNYLGQPCRRSIFLDEILDVNPCLKPEGKAA